MTRASLLLLVACAHHPAAAPAPTPTPVSAACDGAPLALEVRPGTVSAERWTWTFTVTAPGSKSEGARGELAFDGVPIESPGVVGAYTCTPWGPMQWMGDPEVLWGDHGWFPPDPGAGLGPRLTPPWMNWGEPVVTVLSLLPGPPDDVLDPAVREALTELRVREAHVERRWQPLTHQAVRLVDTKNEGVLTVRQAPARDEDVLTVQIGGTNPVRVDLPRADGAVRAIRHVLDAGMDPVERVLALRVDRAASWWRAPLDLGPEADGRTVRVEDVREIVVALPGDLDSGLVWTVRPPAGEVVTVQGEPQFVADPTGPRRTGAWETVLRVRGGGAVVLEAELRRPWDSEAPPTRTWRVTLDVDGWVPSDPK